MRYSIQNYLKTLFSLCILDKKGIVKSSEISKKLNLSAPSVSEMIKRLAAEGFVKTKPYKGVELTPKGRSIGQNILRHHRIWETYLHSVLGFSWDKVHDEAERLEHASSDEVIDKLDALLGHPKFDPHGNPIPAKDGSIPSIKNEIPLSSCKKGDQVTLMRFVDLDKKFLSYIESLGISIKTTIIIEDILELDGTYLCKNKQTHFQISAIAAEHIFVTSCA